MLEGVVPLSRLILALPETRVAVFAEPRVISCPAEAHQDEVAELFDKYNLHALPVVDSANRLVGWFRRTMYCISTSQTMNQCCFAAVQ